MDLFVKFPRKKYQFNIFLVSADLIGPLVQMRRQILTATYKLLEVGMFFLCVLMNTKEGLFLNHFSLNGFRFVQTDKYAEPEVQIQGVCVFMVRQMGK